MPPGCLETSHQVKIGRLGYRQPMSTLPELEQRLRERLDALPKAARAELLHVLMLLDFDRAARIGEFWGEPRTRTFGELPDRS